MTATSIRHGRSSTSSGCVSAAVASGQRVGLREEPYGRGYETVGLRDRVGERDARARAVVGADAPEADVPVTDLAAHRPGVDAHPLDQHRAQRGRPLEDATVDQRAVEAAEVVEAGDQAARAMDVKRRVPTRCVELPEVL